MRNFQLLGVTHLKQIFKDVGCFHGAFSPMKTTHCVSPNFKDEEKSVGRHQFPPDPLLILPSPALLSPDLRT
jgi:hypothetical protein